MPEAGRIKAAIGEVGVVQTAADQPLIRHDPEAAAFFDLDNTVIQGASMYHLAKGLYRRDFFPTRLILKAIWLQIYFRVVGRENQQHIDDAREAVLLFIVGHTVAELEEIGSGFGTTGGGFDDLGDLGDVGRGSDDDKK